MNARQIIATFGGVVLLCAAPVGADWRPGDSHKMHFPQLPDPFGWDVEIVTPQHEIADDWRCSQTGPVSDIHFWYSVAQGLETRIDHVLATIYADDRTGPFSKPGHVLWSRNFDLAAGEFKVVRDYGTGLQGFADPQQPIWTPADHATFHQINIENIVDPFRQELDTIYWLGLSVAWDVSPQSPVGWKTTLNPFADTAVFRPLLPGLPWAPLDPQYGAPRPLDMAFVITGVPEPATGGLALLGAVCGAIAQARRRR
ncbi:MAG: hypothetical protein KF688_10950 [Pirellulales bacterium]|nr:hypothetical protein [Pirellulales bacterium]